MIREFGLSLSLIFLSAGSALAGTESACEVVLMEPVMDKGVDIGAEMASFRPADAFMASVYDDMDGYKDEQDGFKIRGVMCTRDNIIPTLRDFPILATGLPFSISQNFDSAESGLMTLYYKDNRFWHAYSGPPLSDADIGALLDVMDVFNLQPHDLPKTETKQQEPLTQ